MKGILVFWVVTITYVFNMKLFPFYKNADEKVVFKAIALSNVHYSISKKLNTSTYLDYLNNVLFENRLNKNTLYNMLSYCEKRKYIEEYKLYYDTIKYFEKIPKLNKSYHELLYGYLLIAAYESRELNKEDATVHFMFLANQLKQLLSKNKVQYNFWTIQELQVFEDKRNKDCLLGNNKPFLTFIFK
jgi:hypothetical protein